MLEARGLEKYGITKIQFERNYQAADFQENKQFISQKIGRQHIVKQQITPISNQVVKINALYHKKCNLNEYIGLVSEVHSNEWTCI